MTTVKVSGDVHKSEAVRAIADENGWQSTVVPVLDAFEKTGNASDIAWTLYCIRGDETIKATWQGDRFSGSKYTCGSYARFPARTGGVLKFLTGTPEVNSRSSEGTNARNVPWEDDDEVTAFEVLVAVVNKVITWKSAISGEEKTQTCPAESNLRKAHFRVKTTNAGKRVLEWSNNYGFHACYLENITRIEE